MEKIKNYGANIWNNRRYRYILIGLIVAIILLIIIIIIIAACIAKKKIRRSNQNDSICAGQENRSKICSGNTIRL